MLTCAALAAAVFALGTGNATAASFSCNDISPFCYYKCDCGIMSCGESCDICAGGHRVWCEDAP